MWPLARHRDRGLPGRCAETGRYVAFVRSTNQNKLASENSLTGHEKPRYRRVHLTRGTHQSHTTLTIVRHGLACLLAVGFVWWTIAGAAARAQDIPDPLAAAGPEPAES